VDSQYGLAVMPISQRTNRCERPEEIHFQP